MNTHGDKDRSADDGWICTQGGTHRKLRIYSELRPQVGDLTLVPKEDRISGAGTSVIMAAFTHPNRAGSRFSAGAFGVYYAAADQATAIAETRYHRERVLKPVHQGAHLEYFYNGQRITHVARLTQLQP